MPFAFELGLLTIKRGDFIRASQGTGVSMPAAELS